MTQPDRGLTRDTVEKVALLARLRLEEDEVQRMTAQLGAIVGYVEQLAEVDTSGVEPLAHPLDAANVFRRDELRPSLPREAALANAPKTDGECYLVPPVMGAS